MFLLTAGCTNYETMAKLRPETSFYNITSAVFVTENKFKDSTFSLPRKLL